MFSFGIFATHTPYIILATLYLFYIGSWIISSLFPQLPVELAEKTPQAVIEHHQAGWEQQSNIHAKVDNDSFHFWLYKTKQALVSSKITLPTTGYRLVLVYEKNILNLPYLPVYRLYNRPPPFVL
jgi:hypothetical protein